MAACWDRKLTSLRVGGFGSNSYVAETVASGVSFGVMLLSEKEVLSPNGGSLSIAW